MTAPSISDASASLFSHVSADKRVEYRAVMEVFAAAKRQFRLHLRPDEVRSEVQWPDTEPPSLEAIHALLDQLTDWGNLEAQPDTSRVSTLEDFYRKRLLYRLSEGGEAVEASLETFARAMARRAELQTVALIDIETRLATLIQLADEDPLDVAKVHGALRDLATVFEGLAENAQAFVASLARSMEMRRGDVAAVMQYKRRLIGYLQRFIGDLVTYSGHIERSLRHLTPRMDPLLDAVASREAKDAAPAGTEEVDAAHRERLAAWRERWTGLCGWFTSSGHVPSQAELLRSRARAAIPQLLSAITALNERRSGRSDRNADFRTLARWFADTGTDAEAHRLWRAGFALSPARHLAQVAADEGISPSTSWRDAPPIEVHPRLRERGRLTPRGAPPRVRDRGAERARLARELSREHEALEAARRRFATGEPIRLSSLGRLTDIEFRVLLSIIGEALAAQEDPTQPVTRVSGDGSVNIRLEPAVAEALARIETDAGFLAGNDHLLTVSFGEASGR